MKALSIRQPWAALIAAGLKTIETRTWQTPYRGPLLIVASTQIDRSARRWLWLRHPQAMARLVRQFPGLEDLRGVALARVTLSGCEPMAAADTHAALCPVYARAWSWHLSDPHRLRPFPVRGRLMLFDVPLPINSNDA